LKGNWKISPPAEFSRFHISHNTWEQHADRKLKNTNFAALYVIVPFRSYVTHLHAVQLTTRFVVRLVALLP